MTKHEADELHLIEDGITIDPVARRSWFKYPFIKNPNVLQNNCYQVIAIEKSVQQSLIKKDQLEIYNEVIRDYIKRGVICKLTQEEMDDWDGPVNYVPHHAVKKPDSLSTALRFVCNSSVNNNGTSKDEL